MCRPSDYLPRDVPIGVQPRDPRSMARLIGKLDLAMACLHLPVVSQNSTINQTRSAPEATTTTTNTFVTPSSVEQKSCWLDPSPSTVSSLHTTVMMLETSEPHSNTPKTEYSENNDPTSKKRSRRGRRPNNGLTRGHHDRIFVHHSYHDHAREEPDSRDTLAQLKQKRAGNMNVPFPVVLHKILDQAESEGYANAISWQPHGRAFLVHDQEQFVTEVMPRFFRQTRFSSFQCQLSLYGFLRLARKGADNGAYYNEYFLRGKPFLCRNMSRTRIKGYWVRQSSSPETEPDFYSLPPLNDSAVPRKVGSNSMTTNFYGSGNSQMETTRTTATNGEAGAVDFDPLPLTEAFSAPWTVPVDYQIVTSARGASTDHIRHVHHYHHPHHSCPKPLPPMPPLSSYRQDIPQDVDSRDLLSLWSMPPTIVPAAEAPAPLIEEPRGTTGDISAADQEALAVFLSDVDLESEYSDNEDEDYQDEHQMADIFAHSTRAW